MGWIVRWWNIAMVCWLVVGLMGQEGETGAGGSALVVLPVALIGNAVIVLVWLVRWRLRGGRWSGT